MSARSFYMLIAALSAAVIAKILLWSYVLPPSIAHHSGCIFKSVTGVPCPTCGLTRSVSLLLRGDITSSLAVHPLGFPVLAAIVLLLYHIAFDILSGDTSLFRLYTKLGKRKRNMAYWIPAGAVILGVWVYNIAGRQC